MASSNTSNTATGKQVPSYLIDSTMPQAVNDLVREGRITDAIAYLQTKGDAGVPGASDEIQRLQRLKRDYSQTSAELLEKVRKAIPDATADDLDHWRESGGIQWLLVDGELCYFRREPSNLWRFCKEAGELRTKAQGKTGAAGDPAAVRDVRGRLFGNRRGQER